MWALDLGTTNRGLSHWDERLQCPRLWPMPQIGARANRLTLDDLVLGCRAASESAPLRAALTSVGELAAARQNAFAYLEQWLRTARSESRQRIKDLVVVLPNRASDRSHIELTRLFGKLGINVSFLSEPVAAALGYGLTFDRPRRVLVASFGEHRLELVAVELRGDRRGGIAARTLAIASSLIGAHQVDVWLLDELYRAHGYPSFDPSHADAPSWHELMLEETRKVRLRALQHGRSAFSLMPPEELREFSARLCGPAPLFELTRDEIGRVLDEFDLSGEISRTTERALHSLRRLTGTSQLDDVLLVGDSMLLPGVAAWFRARFGGAPVRDDEPLLATIHGACKHAARTRGAPEPRRDSERTAIPAKRARWGQSAEPIVTGLGVAWVALQIVAAASVVVPGFVLLVLTLPAALMAIALLLGIVIVMKVKRVLDTH
jgi:hypothetical protein